MSRISNKIPTLVNGVSQQIHTQRLASQAQEQVNFLSSIAHGLRRRPPTQHIAKLSVEDWSNAKIHVINRDLKERYIVVFTDGGIKVFDTEGVEKTVNFPDGQNYLQAADPRAEIRAVTIADYSFVLNRTVTAKMTTEKTAKRFKEALINVRLGNYGRTYKVIINGAQKAHYTTPNGSVASHANDIDTVAIAKKLYNQLVNAGMTGFAIKRIQSAIYLWKQSGDFTISVEDGFSGSAMKVAKDRLQRFSDLPKVGPDGFHLEIVGDQNTAFDNYYVAFDKTSEEDSEGVWREAAAQDITYKIDSSTMPHILVREKDSSFTFKQAVWQDRSVGDDESASPPSFIDRTINDVFFFRNRLGFLADENVILSRAGDFFNFWPKTVTAQLDSDPIDVASTHSRISILEHAEPFNKSLLLFSGQTQFIFEGGDFITPGNASIKPLSEYAINLDAKPVSAGRNIFFATNRGGSTAIREYFIDALAEVSEAAEITAHAPTYIPAGVRQIAAASNSDFLIALANGAPHKLFAYSYHWDRDDKLQSAWSEWRFDPNDTVLSAEFLKSELFLIIARSDAVYLEKISLDLGAVEPETSLLFHLDRKITHEHCQIDVVGPPAAVKTEITLPYAQTAPLMVMQSASEGAVGRLVDYTILAADKIALQGDYSQIPLIIGRPYLSRYVFSPFIVRDPESGHAAVREDKRLQILNITVNFKDAAFFRLLVDRRDGRISTYPHSSKVTGAGDNVLGQAVLSTGVFNAPVYSKNTAVLVCLEVDGPFAASFLEASWTGLLSSKNRAR